jgi:hypothetical protein
MQELFSEEQLPWIVLGLCALITFGSLFFGFFWQSRVPKSKRRFFWIQVAVVTLIGPLLWLLWLSYNAIEDHYGLDSVKALEINFAIFIGTGFLVSYLFSALPVRFSKTKKV